MPEGFEQLPQAEVAGILEYLSTSKVKHFEPLRPSRGAPRNDG